MDKERRVHIGVARKFSFCRQYFPWVKLQDKPAKQFNAVCEVPKPHWGYVGTTVQVCAQQWKVYRLGDNDDSPRIII